MLAGALAKRCWRRKLAAGGGSEAAAACHVAGIKRRFNGEISRKSTSFSRYLLLLKASLILMSPAGAL